MREDAERKPLPFVVPHVFERRLHVADRGLELAQQHPDDADMEQRLGARRLVAGLSGQGLTGPKCLDGPPVLATQPVDMPLVDAEHGLTPHVAQGNRDRLGLLEMPAALGDTAQAMER